MQFWDMKSYKWWTLECGTGSSKMGGSQKLLVIITSWEKMGSIWPVGLPCWDCRDFIKKSLDTELHQLQIHILASDWTSPVGKGLLHVSRKRQANKCLQIHTDSLVQSHVNKILHSPHWWWAVTGHEFRAIKAQKVSCNSKSQQFSYIWKEQRHLLS